MKVKAFIFYAAGLLLIAAVIALVVLNLESRPDRDFVPNVLALVNGVEIHEEEVNRFLNLAGQAESADRSELREKQRSALDALIDREIYRQEAERRGIGVSGEEVEQRISRKYESQGKERFEEILKEWNVSLEEYKDELRAGLRYDKLKDVLSGELRSGIDVRDQEVRQYYEENKDLLFVDAQIAHIYIMVRGQGEEVEAAALEKAENIIAELNAGADFAELAREYSDDQETRNDGGRLGDIKDYSISEALRHEALKLEPGQHSRTPIRQHSALHILKCLDRSVVPFDEVEDQIREAIARPKLQAAIEAYFDRLREEADIKDFLK